MPDYDIFLFLGCKTPKFINKTSYTVYTAALILYAGSSENIN
jgi:hypothetical protein